MRRRSLWVFVSVSVLASAAFGAPPKKKRSPHRRTPQANVAPKVAAPIAGPVLEASEIPVEDIDVSAVPVAPAPKAVPKRRGASDSVPEPAPSNRPVSGDDGETFKLRLGLSLASYQYAEVAPTPLSMSTSYLNASLAISRRIFTKGFLALSVDTPVLKLSSAAPANFGPLLGRFSVGRDFQWGERWESNVTLSYLFLTTVGTRAGFGFADVSGVQGSVRARYRLMEKRRLEFELAAAFLGSRQSGIVTGDRYLGLQIAYLWLDCAGMRSFGPFVAIDEVKAEFPDKRTAGGRFRAGALVEF